MAKNENHPKRLYNNLNEAFHALIAMQKKPALCEVPFMENKSKNRKNLPFFKKYNFFEFFHDFLFLPEMGLQRKLRFLAL